MEITLIYLQILGIMFGFSVINSFESMTKFQLAKVIFISILPMLLYINLIRLGKL